MTPREVLRYLKATPFRPFRIRMNSGRTFDVRHPEMVKVGQKDLFFFTFVNDSLRVYENWELLSLALIQSVSTIQVQVSKESSDVA